MNAASVASPIPALPVPTAHVASPATDLPAAVLSAAPVAPLSATPDTPVTPAATHLATPVPALQSKENKVIRDVHHGGNISIHSNVLVTSAQSYNGIHQLIVSNSNNVSNMMNSIACFIHYCPPSPHPSFLKEI